jgi:NHLM bacteriocin system ABC transporter peptidase/ATP-binding protein
MDEPVIERTRRRLAAVAERARRALPYRRVGRPARPPSRRVSTPTVLQMEAVECGAASLAMILGYFGRIVPLEELRTACGVSRDGSKANNVLRAARQYGLNAKGYKREPADLRSMPLPAIIHWNFNHFVVLEGFRRDRVYLNDPNVGPTIVSAEEFDRAFTGVVMVFTPTEQFVRGGTPPGLVAPLRRRLVGSATALGFVLLAGLALTMPGLVGPTFNRIFIDKIVVGGFTRWLTPLLLAMAVAMTLTGVLTWVQQRYLLRLETKLALSTSSRFLWHTLKLPVEYFSQRYAGEIGNRVGINDRIAQLLSGDLATTTLNLAMIAFYAFLLLRYDIPLTLIGIGIALLNLGALKVVSRKRTDLNQRLQQDRGKLMGTAMGGLQTLETLKASGGESDFFARWSGYLAKVTNTYQQLQFETLLLSSAPPLLMAINAALMIGIGGQRVMDGHLTIGMLVAFQALMAAFITPVNRMVDLGGTLQEVRSDMNRLDDVLNATGDPVTTEVQETAKPEVAKLAGRLELRDVTFGYSPLDPPLIQGLSMTLEPGSRVAVIGASGSGKSTVAHLVAGLYTPWSGAILFDGRPRREYPRAVMAQSVAMVDQEISLFEDTVRDNLTLWDATIPEGDVVQAAVDACIDDDVSARPGGYGGVLEEGGRNLSGGQRQRLEIARALVVNPSVLVLDEATSALDPETEHRIDDHVRRRGCTCLIVAHRLSTIRDCDEIIVLDRGRVVQRGTHASMSAVSGPYRDLISAE